jgi:hypothetical protein
MKRNLMILITLLVTFSAMAGTMYEWRDPVSGKLVLGDKPPTGGVQYWIEGQRPVPASVNDRQVINQQPQKSSNEWYKGGTLHKATAYDWKQASKENRLATAADFASVILKDKFKNMEQLKIHANELEKCITEATKKEIKNMQVATIASSCIVIMGWK